MNCLRRQIIIPATLLANDPCFAQGLLVRILGKSPPIAFAPRWAERLMAYFDLLSRIRVGTELNISNIDSLKHQPNMYISLLRFQECNPKPEVQSTRENRRDTSGK